jgi:hypothetical protein
MEIDMPFNGAYGDAHVFRQHAPESLRPRVKSRVIHRTQNLEQKRRRMYVAPKNRRRSTRVKAAPRRVSVPVLTSPTLPPPPPHSPRPPYPLSDGERELVLEGLLPLFEQTQSAHAEQVLGKWKEMRDRVILPLYYQHQEDPYKTLNAWHLWLRNAKHRGVPYGGGAIWMFLELENQTHCNCLCSSTWLLACASVVGWFPGRLGLGTLPKHAVVARLEDGMVLETTCTDVLWEPLQQAWVKHQFPPETEMFTAATPSAVVAHVAANASLMAKREIRISLLDAHPDTRSPFWWFMRALAAFRPHQTLEQIQFSLSAWRGFAPFLVPKWLSIFTVPGLAAIPSMLRELGQALLSTEWAAYPHFVANWVHPIFEELKVYQGLCLEALGVWAQTSSEAKISWANERAKFVEWERTFVVS